MNAHLRQRAAYYDQYSTVWITRKGKRDKSLQAFGNKKGRWWSTARKATEANPGRVYPSPGLIKSGPIPTSLPTTSVSFVGHPRPGKKSPHFSAGTTSDVTDTGGYFITALTNEQPSTSLFPEGTSVEEHRRGYGWMGRTLAHMCVVGTRAFSFLSGCRCASIHRVLTEGSIVQAVGG
jgi:hypothetical protein